MTIAILIISLILLILIHELGHFWAAKLSGVKVEEFGIGFPPRIFSRKVGETRYSFNLLPLGGFVRLYGEGGFDEGDEPDDAARAFVRQSALKRIAIIVAGVVMNFVLGWAILTAVFAIGSEERLIVTFVAPESPAAMAGFETGDTLTGFATADAFIEFVDEKRGQEVSIEIERTIDAEKSALSIDAVPRVTPPEGEGALGVGISELGIAKQPFFQSVWSGLKQSVFITGEIFKGLGRLVSDLFVHQEVTGELVGPVGIFSVANETSRLGLLYLFQFIAIISFHLAVLNILPIPALDGGRLLFIVIGKIRGKPVNERREAYTHAIGFIILITLIVVLTVRDVANLL